MNITVIGAGAIGGHIAARLAAAGERVKVVARGAHLKAIRERGLILKEGGEEIVARVEATDRIAEAGGADLDRARGQGAPTDADRSRRGRDRLALDHGHDDAKRHTLVVFPQARRPI